MLALAVYVGVTFLGYFMRTAAHFFALALLVGMVQGGSQALSRSLFAQMVPRDRAAEFFGLFSVFEKVTAVAGPLVFAATVELTGSSRQAVLSLLVFFGSGAAVLWRVDVEAGRRAAREAEARAGWRGDGDRRRAGCPRRARRTRAAASEPSVLDGRDFPWRGEEAVPPVVEHHLAVDHLAHVLHGHREVMLADEALLHDEFIPVMSTMRPDFRTTEHGCLPQGGPWSPVRESWLSPRKPAADRRGAAPVKPA